MKEFMALRIKARQRRDLEIAKSRQDYEASLLKIAELEQRLLGKDDPRRIKVTAAIERVIPRDLEFSVNEVMIALEALDPSRVWKRPFVGRHIRRLRELGLLKRAARATPANPATYIRVSGPAERTVADKPLRLVLKDVVTRPMFIAEVVAAVLAAGYKTTMVSEHFRTFCLAELRKAGFRQDGGKWLP